MIITIGFTLADFGGGTRTRGYDPVVLIFFHFNTLLGKLTIELAPPLRVALPEKSWT